MFLMNLIIWRFIMKVFENIDEIVVRGEADLRRLTPNFVKASDLTNCDYDIDYGVINKSLNRLNGRIRKALSGRRGLVRSW
jgi:hypothetical protein